MKVFACVEFAADGVTCTTQAWVELPGLLPPLPVAQGLQLAGAMIGVVMLGWGWRFLRRYLNPRS